MDKNKSYILVFFPIALSSLSVIIAILVCRHYFFEIGDLGGFYYLIATFLLSIVLVSLLIFLPGKATNSMKLSLITLFIVIINVFGHDYTFNERMIGGWYVIPADFNPSKVKSNVLYKIIIESDSYDEILYVLKTSYPKSKENIYHLIDKSRLENSDSYHHSKLLRDLLIVLSMNHDSYAIPLWKRILKDSRDDHIKQTSKNALKMYYNID